MFDPGVLLLRLAGGRRRAPLGFGQFGGQAVQLVGPFVITDAPAAELSALDPVEVLAGAGATVGVEIAGPTRPAMLVLVEQYRQVFAHVAGAVEDAIQQPGAQPQRL